jgi:hypothetical protein
MQKRGRYGRLFPLNFFHGRCIHGSVLFVFGSGLFFVLTSLLLLLGIGLRLQGGGIGFLIRCDF